MTTLSMGDMTLEPTGQDVNGTIEYQTSTSMRGCLAVAAMLEEQFDRVTVACHTSGVVGLINIDITVTAGASAGTLSLIRNKLTTALKAVDKYEEIWK